MTTATTPTTMATATMTATVMTVLLITTTNDIPNRMFFFSFFLCRIEGSEKLGDMQANSKNVAGITVSTTQCLYVVR